MKNKYSYLVILLVAFLLFGIQSALAQDDPPPLPPGTVEGTGTYFEVTDSEYLNVTLESTESVNVVLESVPQMVVMHLEAAEGAASTQITLWGFTPLTTYYKYEDDYHNEMVFTTDSNGGYSYLQDLSEPHLVFIQPNAGTYFIRDDATGGDCSLIGTWDSDTKTCTLTGDVSETIQINSSYLTLDGDGYTVDYGTGYGGYGIRLGGRTGVTLKDLRVENFSYGLSLRHSSNNTLTGNTASNNIYGIHVDRSTYNTLTGNTASSNLYIGISLTRYSHNNQLTENTSSSHNRYGIHLSASKNNEIYNNNFIDNSTQAYLYGYSSVFNLPSPIGGNFWSDWTTPDDDGDGFVDYPYTFTGGQDNLPWTRQDGWLDNEGPITTDALFDPYPVAVNSAIYLTADVDDSTTGGSVIASAEYNIDDGDFMEMYAYDCDFDEVSEEVYADIPGFTETGVYKICIQGTDSRGNTGIEECSYLPVYDPDGGFVTGGGWIESPEGACQLAWCEENTTGKATFGFVSKYKTGASVPTGQTQFQFKAGDLNFHSDVYDWLVVAGPHAKFKGTGTINGSGNYGFILTATDSEINGGGDIDGFRIKIWDKDDGDTVVYDNKMGEGDDSNATTELGGGNIKIHKGQ